MMMSLVPIGLTRVGGQKTQNATLRGKNAGLKGAITAKSPEYKDNTSYTFEFLEGDIIDADFDEEPQNQSYPFKSYQKALRLMSARWQYLDLYA